MIGLGTYQSVILKLRIQKVLTTVYILHKVLSTHGISSWGMRNQGIWWQGIPHKENRQGKQGIHQPKMKVFLAKIGLKNWKKCKILYLKKIDA